MRVWLPAIRTGTGTDVFTQRLAKGLRDRGVAVEISWHAHQYEAVPHLLRYLSGFKIKPDIIHANSWNAFAFKRQGIKTLATVHLCVHDESLSKYKSLLQSKYHDWFIRNYEYRSFRYSDTVSAVSQYTADITREIFDVPDVHVIYNGIDTDRYAPSYSEGQDGIPFRLFFSGSPTRRKGFDLLVDIMQELGPGYMLHHAGKPVPNMGSGYDNIQGLGYLDEEGLVREYNRCDVLVFPSRAEGFGYSVCEAMACEKPVIASKNTSLKELVVDGESGILCPTDDVSAFVKAVKTLAGDREKARGMGKAGRRRVMQMFSLDVMVNGYIDLYESMLT